MRRNNSKGADGISVAGALLLIVFAFAVLAMPFVGAYKLSNATTEKDRRLGKILLMCGTVLYVVAAFNALGK